MAPRKPFLERIIALHHMTLEMAEQSSESDIQRLAVEQATRHLDIDRFAVFVIEDDPQFMHGTWGTTPDGEISDESDYRANIAGHHMISRTLLRRDLVAVEDPAELRWCHRVVGKGWNAMVAMWQGDRALGFISADNLLRQRAFTDEDREVLKLVAASVGQMLLRVRAENELRQLNRELEARVAARTRALSEANQRLEILARTDSLTDLANRREFDEVLHREWHRARRIRAQISLLLLDIDFFKRYNDALGHEAGDDCLRQIGILLKACCRRSTEVAARIGGEEFALLLPDTEPEDCLSIGQAVLDGLEKINMPHPDSPIATRVTASIGAVTVVPQMHEQDLQKKADQALYLAKHAGRNCLRVFSG